MGEFRIFKSGCGHIELTINLLRLQAVVQCFCCKGRGAGAPERGEQEEVAPLPNIQLPSP